MSSIRAFIAVEIDPQAKQKISELISCLKKSNADVKWITESQMHLTLKFLGNIDKDRIKEISDALSVISSTLKPFTIGFLGIGAFPNIDHPRVIWIGINKGAASLKILAEKIETTMEKLGFAKESREFTAHLTLGRIRASGNIHNLIKLLKETSFSLETGIVVTEPILFQSTLTPKGAIYSKL